MTTDGIAPTDSTRVRVGLIGFGRMGMQHVRAISQVQGSQLVAVADPAASAETESELPTGARLFTSAEEMLAVARPDVVHIVTPPGSHYALAKLTLEAGSHVYVEKPFTPTRAEAESLLALAAARGLQVCPGHQILFERPARLALQELATIGRLVHVESFFSFKMVRRTITPADQVKDILPHAVYPVVEQLRAATGIADEPIVLVGVDVRAEGDLYAIVRLGECTGVVLVTLNGRPIETYQTLVGTNGSLRADYITGAVTRLVGPGTGPGVLFTPYRRASQTLTGATRGFSKLIFGRKTSYPGLTALVDRFHAGVRDGRPSPLTPRSIIDTVDLCERMGAVLDEACARSEALAGARLQREEATLPQVDAAKGVVLVTGGTGLLGKRVAEEVRAAGYAVRVLGRRKPRIAVRLPGVEYVVADLAAGEPDASIMGGVSFVAHCAAETAGGKAEHERNSIGATEHIFRASSRAGVRAFIHVSSIAVLTPSRSAAGLDEQSAVDAGNLGRGPYVWGKAESEVLVQKLGVELGLPVKVIRPGPLVDYRDFHPPGRLGREVGPWFVAIGPRRGPLSVCDVSTGAQVIRWYIEHFDSAPSMLNMVEAPPPARLDLIGRVRADRPDLRVLWIPGFVLRVLSGPLKLLQRVALGSAKPIDVYEAFASTRYRTDLAAKVIGQARPDDRR